MNNKALALLIILQAIRANRSIHPSNDVEGIGGAEASSCTLARSIDRSGRNGSFSNETQFCEAWKGTKKNFENGSYHETIGKFPVCAGLTSDGISHMLRFTPNFTFVQNAECREQVNVFLRELRNYKFWAMEMLDSNAKLPSSLLQGNVNQLGDFDQCLNVAARERWNGREIRIKGRYFLTLIDVDATHPITERLVFVMKAHNIFLSNLHEKRGHFFPKFPLIRWALCLPSACSNEDARSVIQHALNEYNSTAGIRFMVRADPNTSYVKHESSNYTKETIYVLCFFAIVACLVAATTMRDYLGTRGEKEKENSLERIAMGFSLRRSAKSLFKKETGPNDITCIHGMKSILAVLLSMAHRNMTLCIMPYMNRIYYSHVAKEPLSVIIRLAMIYTDSFLLFSGTLISFNMTHELTTRGEIRWFRRLVSRYVRLTPMLLVVVLYYAYVMEHTGSGPEWNINVKNADLCKKTGWMNLLYAQIFLPFEDQCAFNKAIGTLSSSGGKGPKNFGRWGSLKDKRHNSQASLTSVHQRGTVRHSADSDSGTECVHTFQRAALYILGEKAHMKGVKAESAPKTDFIPVEYYDVRHTKAAFKKLMRACVPSSPNVEPDQSFYKLIESSEWLQQLQNLMQLAGAVIDLMDVQGSSVAVCLEDGWDTTATVCSVAQVCLDPHYRTIEGFRTLIEKEWLGFGHRFGHRSNLAANSQTTNFTPTFLQFLDIVHQIQKQFPLAFEFNEYYLKFLAYHSVSCRFRTFLLDCEFDRVECGITAVEDKRGSLTSHHKGVDTGSDDETIYPGGRLAGTNTGCNLGQSIFDYIEKQHARCPLFYNFIYTPNTENMVLRPVSHLPNLDIWQYYLEEELAHGPAYDLEVLQQDSQQEEEAEAADGVVKSNRKVVTQGYDGISSMVPDQFSHLLEEIHRLETELGHLPQKWKVLWDKLELPNTDSLARHASFSTALVRYHGRLIHKRSTLELLLRGKLASGSSSGNDGSVYAHPHRFERLDSATPTHCDACSGVLWGPVKAGLRCVDCGHVCHDKCADAVPKNCTKYKTVTDNLQTHTLTRSGGDNGSVNSSVTTIQTSSQQYYEQFSSNVAENRTHEGYLYKRGALLKGWKQRWFVLDSIKHQLRYYDAMEDSHCKGYIDLAEVVSVTPAQPMPGPPKKTDDKSFFDLRTNRRTYNFCAGDATTAQEWIEKVQACLQ